MGCDIHLHIETQGDDGAWRAHDFRSKYVKNTDDTRYTEFDYSGLFQDPLWIPRHYNVFAVLANVRNDRGFAGVPTGGGFKPVAMPRGMPKDADPATVRDYTLRVSAAEGERLVKRDLAEKWLASGSSQWWDEPDGVITHPDWHSASWLLAAELRDYNWQQETTQTGAVDPAQFKEFREHGKPRSWCGSVSGGGVTYLSNAGMEYALANNRIHWLKPPDPGRHNNPYVTQDELDTEGTTLADYTREVNPLYPLKSYYTQVVWKESYASACGDFTTRFLPALLALGDPAKTRLVFWFDN